MKIEVMTEALSWKARVAGAALTFVVVILIGFALRLSGREFALLLLTALTLSVTFCLAGMSPNKLQIALDRWTTSSVSTSGLGSAQKWRTLELIIAVAASILVLVAVLLYSLGVTAITKILIVAAAVSVGYFCIVMTELLLLNAYASDAVQLHQNAAKSAIRSLKPKFAFHFSAPDLNVPFHVLMWLPYLEALDIPFFIIVREKKHLASLEKRTKAPVIFLGKEPDLFGSIPPSVSAIFYANNGTKNLDLISTYPSIEHIQLLHGDSDKPPSFNPVSKVFSKLFVAGQMAIDRYERNGVTIPASNFRIVGRPQVSRIEDVSVRPVGEVLVIGYLPTWAGYHEDTKFSSLRQAADLIEDILAQDRPTKVLFKPHPLSYKDKKSSEYLREIRNVLERPRTNGNCGQFVPDSADVLDLYNQFDILISDISSVIIDFLYSGKPHLVTNPSGFSSAALELYPSLGGAYILDKEARNARSLIESALTNDPIRDKRLQTREYAFGDLAHEPGELFRKICLDIVDLPEPRFVKEPEAPVYQHPVQAELTTLQPAKAQRRQNRG